METIWHLSEKVDSEECTQRLWQLQMKSSVWGKAYSRAKPLSKLQAWKSVKLQIMFIKSGLSLYFQSCLSMTLSSRGVAEELKGKPCFKMMIFTSLDRWDVFSWHHFVISDWRYIFTLISVCKLAVCRMKNALFSLLYVSTPFLSLLQILPVPVVFSRIWHWRHAHGQTKSLSCLAPHPKTASRQRCSPRLSDFHLSFLLSKLAPWHTPSL